MKGSIMSAEAERRFTSVPVEIRAGSDKKVIGGYAAKFNKRSHNLGGFVERVADEFFNKARGDGWAGVVARHNHDDNMLLGTTAARTLRLNIDKVGLAYEVDVPNSRADIYELVERGDVRQSSFAFVAYEDDWGTSEEGYPLRTLVSGRLLDVASVNSPAYEDTSVGVRSIEGALESLAKKFDADLSEVRNLSEAGDLMKFFKRSDKAEVVRSITSQEAMARVLALKD